jgi:GNAT superfamily N-acetyltransferase
MARLISYIIFTGQELYNFLIDYKAEDPRYKFDETKSRLKYFVTKDIVPGDFAPKDQEHYFFCAIEGENKIVGILKLKTGGFASMSYPEYKNWISSCSVDKDYQGQGIARKLVEMMFHFATEKNINILTSGYTDEGFKKLKHVFKRYADIYGVDFKDNHDRATF